MFGQGIPFFHAGDDLLRSKSLDRNSYDSGDWFNRLDWTGNSTWGAGLPITAGEMGGFYARLLSDPALKPSPEDALRSAAIFRENLRIRRSSPLFHLPTAEDIRRDLSFLNPVEGPFPGLIAMRLTDHSGLDPRFAQIVVVFNASPGWVTLSAPSAQGEYVLHPLHARSVDPRTRQALYDPAGFHIPGRTTAVYVIPR
jgi:pullulanase/glycogen debranching enzyme